MSREFKHTLSAADASALLRAKGKRSVGVHSMTQKVLHWCYCSRCGLLNLKNDVSRKSLKMPCVVEND